MIHQTAIIGNKVKLGKNIIVGPFCVIGNGAVISDNVALKSHVVIEGKVKIGENTKIYPFVSLCYPQTLKYNGEDSEIVIGKNNTIREYVTIQHGTSTGSGGKMVTKIGDNCLLMVGVHIAHNCQVGNNVIFANYASLAGHVQVGDFAVFGGLSAVQQFCRIGAYTMVGGVSAVVRDLLPYGLAYSDRAYLAGLNLVGMNRHGLDKKQSMEASQVVKRIFDEHSNLVFKDRIASAKIQYPNNKIIQKIIEFLQEDESRTFCKCKSV